MSRVFFGGKKSHAAISLAMVFCHLISFALPLPVLLGFFSPQIAHAVFNPEINYQGKLLGTSGAAVPDGDYDMSFSLYTAPSGGSAIWTESRTGGSDVTVTSGLFSVMLGDVNSLAGVDFNQTLYLGVSIESDPEMTPRKVLGAVPAAFVAQSAIALGGATSTQYLRSDIAGTLNANSASTALTINQAGAGDILNILDSGSEVFTILDGGKVGIGTTSPSTKLDVNGDMQVVNSSSGSDTTFTVSATNASYSGILQRWFFNGNPVAAVTRTGTIAATTFSASAEVTTNAIYVGGLTAGSIPFLGPTKYLAQNNANLFWDNTNSRLGVGTNTPTERLSVSGNGVFTGTLSASNLSGTNSGDVTLAGQNYLTISGQQITAGLINLTSHVTGALPVANGGTGTSTLPANGRILIGNGTGYSLANITGTTNRVTVTNGAGTITLTGPQDIHTSATPQFARMGLGVAADASVPLTVLRTAAGISTSAILRNAQTAATGTGSELVFQTNRTTGGLTGVASIAGLITDISNTNYKGALIFDTANGGAVAERMRIDHLGNVGIGSTTPSQLLSVGNSFSVSSAGLARASSFVTSGAMYAASVGNFFSYNDNNINFTGTSAMVFNGGGSERMRIDNATGNVGIGTTTPSSKLSVAGSIFATGTITALGTGTSTLSHVLSATGVHVSGLSRFFNTFLQGYNSGGGTDDALKVVSNNSGASFGVQNNSGSGFAGIEYIGSDGNVKVFTGYNNGNAGEFRFNNIASGGFITFKINGTDRLTINNSGVITASNLGGSGSRIVMTDNSGNLSAAATSSLGITSSQWTTAGSNIHFSTGNVGIGTSTPGDKLSVIGNMSLSGTLTVATSTGLLVGTTTPQAGMYNAIVGPSSAVSGSTLLMVRSMGTMGASGSIFRAETAGGTGIRVSETGAFYGPSNVSFAGGPVTMTLGGSNNTNTFTSGNSGSHTATDFVFRAGTADRTAGNLFQVSNNTSPVLTVTAVTGAGNVGIGTTTPSARLVTVANGSSTGKAFLIANSSGAERFLVQDNGTVTVTNTLAMGANAIDGTNYDINADGSASFAIGNVTINTDGEVAAADGFNSSALSHLQSISGSELISSVTSNTSIDFGGRILYDTDGSTMVMTYGNGDGSARFGATNNSYFYADGSLGVVYQGAGQHASLFQTDGSGYLSNGLIQFNSSGDMYAHSYAISGGNSSQFLKADGTVDNSTYLTSISGGDHGSLSGLGDDDHSQYMLLAGRSGGQILIGGTGTTDDLILRNTSGSGTTGSDMIFQGGSNGGTEFARILNNGNFGIGTNNPGAKLHVSGPGARIRIQNTSSDPVIEFTGTSGTSYLFTRSSNWYMRTDSASKHVFFQGGDTPGQQGYVKIGSGSETGTPTDPASQLTVRANSSSSNFGVLDVQSYFGTSTLFVRNDGNIGIGTTTPSARLHMLATSEQQRIGYDAANYLSTTIGSTGTTTWNSVGTSRGFQWAVGGTNKMFMNPDGTIGVGATGAGVGSIASLYLRDDGITPGSSAYYGSVSDVRHSFGSATTMAASQSVIRSTMSTGKTGIGSDSAVNLANASTAGTLIGSRSQIASIGGVNGDLDNFYYFKGESFNMASTNVTTNWYGLHISEAQATGAVNSYEIYLNGLTGSSNQYGVYQASSTSRNYFAGNVGIGTNNPTTKFYVNDSATNLAANTYAQSNILNWAPAATNTTYFASALNNAVIKTGSSNNSATHGVRVLYNSANIQGGVTTQASALYNTVLSGSNGVITHAYGGVFSSPITFGGGTITNSYALLLESQKVSGVTNGYGLYQAGANDLNYFAGNVGIGGAAPVAKLQMSNNVASGNIDAYSEYQYLMYDSGGASNSYGAGIESSHMWFNSGGGYKFYNNGSTIRMMIDTNGRVGIGTSTPAYTLSVAGDTNITGALRFGGNAGTSGQVLQSTGSGAQWVATSTLGIGGGSSQWTTTGSNIYYNTGTIGVGTTTPWVNSKILGANSVSNNSGSYMGVSGYAYVNDGSYATNSYGGYFYASGASNNLSVGVYGEGVINDSNNAYGVWGNTNMGTGVYGTGYIGVVGSGTFGTQGLSNDASGRAGYFNQSNAAGYSLYAQGGINYIQNNLGIGSSTPSAKLAVVGNAGTGDIFGVASSTGARMFTITSNGRVGIGAASPSEALEVNGNIALGSGLNRTISIAGTGASVLTVRGQTNSGSGFGGNLVLTGGNADNDSGSVYVSGGTSSSGNGGSVYLYGGDGNSTNDGNVYLAYSPTAFTAFGNVGIGMASASYRLDVSGDVNVSGALRFSGNAGTAGYVLQSTGSSAQWVSTSTLGIGGGSSQWTTSGSGIHFATGRVAVGTTTFAGAALTVATSTMGEYSNSYGVNSVLTISGYESSGYAGHFKAIAGVDGGNVYGVYGEADPYDMGSYGYGVYGYVAPDKNGTGVNGVGMTGVSGVANTSSGYGVLGLANSVTSGIGVYGVGNASDGTGVSASGWYGVYGTSNSSTGRAGYFNQSNSSGYSIYATGGRNYIQGNLAIGTTTPNAALSVLGGATFGQFGTTTGVASIGADMVNIVSATPMASGVVSPETMLRLVRNGTASNKYNGSADFAIGSYASGIGALTQLNINLGNGNTHVPDITVMKLQGNGWVGIGTSAGPQRKLHVQTSADEPPVRFQDSSGYCEINPTSNIWNCTSDQRLKENIRDLILPYSTTTQSYATSSLALISQLRPVTYSWISDSSHSDRTGLIAQEVEKIFPNLVVTDEQGWKSVGYGGFTIYLIDAVREIAQKLEKMVVWFGEDRFNVQGDVCVDDVCVTKEQFKQMLQNAGTGYYSGGGGGGSYQPQPEPQPNPDPNPTPGDGSGSGSGDGSPAGDPAGDGGTGSTGGSAGGDPGSGDSSGGGTGDGSGAGSGDAGGDSSGGSTGGDSGSSGSGSGDSSGGSSGSDGGASI